MWYVKDLRPSFFIIKKTKNKQTNSALHHPGKWKSESVSLSVMFDSLRTHGLKPTGSSSSWNSPDKNAAVGSHPLLQGILPTQGSNPGLQYRRQILYHLNHQEQRLITSVLDQESQSRRSENASWIEISEIVLKF